jgi:hypothetical protein
MTNDFSQVMSERTDKQLVDIVTLKREEYQPEAIIAAEKEIERRQINTSEFYTEEQIHETQNSSQIDKSDVGFEWYHKLLTVLLPAAIIAAVTIVVNILGQTPILRVLGFPTIILIHYAIHRRFKDNGYTKMAKDFLKWVTYTLYIYIGLILILGLAIYFFFM